MWLPDANSPTPPEIQNSYKFYPFFNCALGAIDGIHIACTATATDRDATRNHKGVLTQNCLAACSFDLRFTYIMSGWEGSAADSRIFSNAHTYNFYIPRGKYYLADTGYASSKVLLVPYRGIRYHLSEWGCADHVYVVYLVSIFSLMTIFLVHTTPRSCSICIMR